MQTTRGLQGAQVLTTTGSPGSTVFTSRPVREGGICQAHLPPVSALTGKVTAGHEGRLVRVLTRAVLPPRPESEARACRRSPAGDLARGTPSPRSARGLRVPAAGQAGLLPPGPLDHALPLLPSLGLTLLILYYLRHRGHGVLLWSPHANCCK